MDVQEKLNKYGISPSQGRSQHFLQNELIADRMVDEADVSEDDTVLEIGAGLGMITRKLAGEAGEVVAYETDGAMVDALQHELEEYDNVHIVRQSILSAEDPDFDKCVSNIPFHLSSDIIKWLGRQQKLSVILVQEAFAEKLVAAPGSQEYSRISVIANYYFVPVFIEQILDINFYPAPETNASLLKLFPNKDRFEVDAENEDFFFTVVNALFTHKNKKVRNAIADSRHLFNLDKEAVHRFRDDLPHSEERVIDLEVKQVVDIATAWQEMLHPSEVEGASAEGEDTVEPFEDADEADETDE